MPSRAWLLRSGGLPGLVRTGMAYGWKEGIGGWMN